MNKQEQLKQEYVEKRRQFEAKEETIFEKRNQGIHELEELAERAEYYLTNYAVEPALITQALHSLDPFKEVIHEAAQQDRKQLERQLETLEEEYHYNHRKLLEQEFMKNEETVHVR